MALYPMVSSSDVTKSVTAWSRHQASVTARDARPVDRNFAETPNPALQIFAKARFRGGFLETRATSANSQTSPCKDVILAVMRHRRARDGGHVQKPPRGDRRGHDMRAIAHAHQDRPDLEPAS